MIDGKLENWERNLLVQKSPQIWQYLVALEAERDSLLATLATERDAWLASSGKKGGDK